MSSTTPVALLPLPPPPLPKSTTTTTTTKRSSSNGLLARRRRTGRLFHTRSVIVDGKSLLAAHTLVVEQINSLKRDQKVNVVGRVWIVDSEQFIDEDEEGEYAPIPERYKQMIADMKQNPTTRRMGVMYHEPVDLSDYFEDDGDDPDHHHLHGGDQVEDFEERQTTVTGRFADCDAVPMGLTFHDVLRLPGEETGFPVQLAYRIQDVSIHYANELPLVKTLNAIAQKTNTDISGVVKSFVGGPIGGGGGGGKRKRNGGGAITRRRRR